MWVIICKIISMLAGIGLLAMAYDMDKSTPAPIRSLMYAASMCFFGVLIAIVNNPTIYEHAAFIAYAAMGTLVISGCLYLALTVQIHGDVIKIAGGALVLSMLLWTVGSCSDTERQKEQMEKINSETVTARPPTEAEQRNRDIIRNSRNRRF